MPRHTQGPSGRRSTAERGRHRDRSATPRSGRGFGSRDEDERHQSGRDDYYDLDQGEGRFEDENWGQDRLRASGRRGRDFDTLDEDQQGRVHMGGRGRLREDSYESDYEDDEEYFDEDDQHEEEGRFASMPRERVRRGPTRSGRVRSPYRNR